MSETGRYKIELLHVHPAIENQTIKQRNKIKKHISKTSAKQTKHLHIHDLN